MDAAGALCEEDSSSWDGAHNETRQGYGQGPDQAELYLQVTFSAGAKAGTLASAL